MAKVFISYSKQDYHGQGSKTVLIDSILNTLSDNGVSYWIDRERLEPGATYAEIIAKNIKECDVFLFISTENANSSEWTLREISMAIDFGKTVLPVKLDDSKYADSVYLYLASIQYVDWNELGREESLRRIVSKLKGGEPQSEVRQFTKAKLPKLLSAVLHTALVFLTFMYAILSYQFLWATTLRSSEILGGLVGYVCELGILLSIYYIFRMLRLRRCVFVLPAVMVAGFILAGMLLIDEDILGCSYLLMHGWLFILFACIISGKKKDKFFRIMSREQLLLKVSDPENLILVYLAFKAFILVFSHYFMATAPV